MKRTFVSSRRSDSADGRTATASTSAHAAATRTTPGLLALCHNVPALEQALLTRMARLLRVGWVDHSPGSYDHRVAQARAYRIRQRLIFRRRLRRHEWQLETHIFWTSAQH